MRRNRIGLFSEDELRAALSLMGTPESAATVARELYSLPESEQAHYNWIDTTLVLLACLSDQLRARVTEHFAKSPEARARLDAARAERQRSSGEARGDGRVVWDLSDVVHDTRQDCTIIRDLRHHCPAVHNFIVLVSEQELREALTLIGDGGGAATVAAALFQLPQEEQAGLDWTDFALGLLACNTDIADREQRICRRSEEALSRLRELGALFRRLNTAGELASLPGPASLETVVRRATE
jgi:hypothetical protein